jgi:hypothetical protein
MHKFDGCKAITKAEFVDLFIENMTEDKDADADFAATPCGLVTDRPQKVFGVMTVQHLIGNDLGRRLPQLVVVGHHDDPDYAVHCIVTRDDRELLRSQLLAVLDALVPGDALYASNYDGSGERGEAVATTTVKGEK